jgi:hypothetical protein
MDTFAPHIKVLPQRPAITIDRTGNEEKGEVTKKSYKNVIFVPMEENSEPVAGHLLACKVTMENCNGLI